MIGSGVCSNCGKKVIVWGDLSLELCMTCDEQKGITELSLGDAHE